MPIEREMLREWVYDALSRPVQQVAGGNQALSLSNVATWVSQKAKQAGLLPPDTIHSTSRLTQVDEDAIRECVWGLIIQGIVVPGVSNEGTYQTNLPWIQVTEWGRLCLQRGQYVPFDTGLFLSRLESQIPGLDSVVELYLREGLNCFRSGNFLGSAVMVGVASERILVLLRDAIHSAILQEDRRKKLMEATENQTAKRIYETVESKIDPIMEQLPTDLRESIGTELEGIFHEIRRTRNNAGHPTGKTIERDEANALLQLFPVYAKSAYALMSWLTQHSV
jgi:hypothetical protein